MYDNEIQGQDRKSLIDRSKKARSQRTRPKNVKLNYKDILAALFLCTVVVVFFAKTVFLGLPISKISFLAKWDSLFACLAAGKSFSIDPSVIQLIVPTDFLVARLWHAGQLPLWNPYNGLGCPLIGDVQATVLSPVRFLFDLFPTMYVYNLTLVSEVVLAALGTFLLARELSLPYYASIFAALTYALCPYTLWYLELLSGTSEALFPFVFWLFARCARERSQASAVAAGLAAGLIILSGHPESSFYGILFACLLLVLLMVTGKESQDPEKHKQYFSLLVSIVALLTLSGVTAFCLSAPVLLPFAEYLMHADCYKYGLSISAYAPLPGIVYNLMQPGFGAASPYPGIVACLMLPFSVFMVATKKKDVLSLIIVALVSLALSCRLGPLHNLLSIGPLKYLITVYCLPVILLSAIMVASFGLVAQENLVFGKNWHTLVFVISALVVLGTPLALHYLNVPLSVGDFDLTLPKMSFDFAAWRRDAVIAFLVLVVIMLKGRLPVRFKLTAACLMVVMGFISQACLARNSLPVESKFDYLFVPPLSYLQESESRVISTGDHLFKPNTNCVYKIAQLQTHSPIYPERYLRFMQACGADVSEFSQVFGTKIKRLVDLAGVKYVLSLLPVVKESQSDSYQASHEILEKQAALPGVYRLKFTYNAENEEIFGRLSMVASPNKYKGCTYSLVVLNKEGHVWWFGDQKKFTGGASPEPIVAPVPLNVPPGTQLQLGLVIFDWQKRRFVPDTKSGAGTIIKLAEFVSGVSKTSNCLFSDSKSLRLNKSISLQLGNHVRLYENPSCLPQAFLVHKVYLASDAEQALTVLGQSNFDPRKAVLLERRDLTGNIARALPLKLDSLESFQKINHQDGDYVNDESVTMSRPNCNSVYVNVMAKKPGALVLTDVFYPGWHAFVDGVEVPITRADYIFRAITVDPGQHFVKFFYQPVSLIIGVALCVLLLCVVSCAGVIGLMRKS